jgi:hypothetical protein
LQQQWPVHLDQRTLTQWASVSPRGPSNAGCTHRHCAAANDDEVPKVDERQTGNQVNTDTCIQNF